MNKAYLLLMLNRAYENKRDRTSIDARILSGFARAVFNKIMRFVPSDAVITEETILENWMLLPLEKEYCIEIIREWENTGRSSTLA